MPLYDVDPFNAFVRSRDEQDQGEFFLKFSSELERQGHAQAKLIPLSLWNSAYFYSGLSEFSLALMQSDFDEVTFLLNTLDVSALNVESRKRA